MKMHPHKKEAVKVHKSGTNGKAFKSSRSSADAEKMAKRKSEDYIHKT